MFEHARGLGQTAAKTTLLDLLPISTRFHFTEPLLIRNKTSLDSNQAQQGRMGHGLPGQPNRESVFLARGVFISRPWSSGADSDIRAAVRACAGMCDCAFFIVVMILHDWSQWFENDVE
jgi:hypothetical protein